MKLKLLLFLVIAESLVIFGLISFQFWVKRDIPLIPPLIQKPLLAYTYKNLRNYHGAASAITIDKELLHGDGFISYIFSYHTGAKKVSGLITLPAKAGDYPLILLIRGYVDPQNYTPGTGTEHDAEYFASHGFITIAPDFLGYGQSDKPATDAFEGRFETYTTVIDLLASFKNMNKAMQGKQLNGYTANTEKIAVWAHSNGGQIALSVAEITGFTYPLVLWAPVSKPFPYSILYYTDEADDQGKSLRKLLADFENLYDVNDYSLTNYIDWLKAPIQIDQGTADEEVPVQWSNDFVQTLKKSGKNVDYQLYQGENHNFQNGTWSKAIEQSLTFINDHLK